MKGREDEVAGERGLDRDARRLAVANLTDHDHVWVGSQHRAEARGEGEPGAAIDAHLVDSIQAVLDRVLDRDDLLLDRVDLVEGCVERGGLTRACRAGNENRAVGLAVRGLVAAATLRRPCRGRRASASPGRCRGCGSWQPSPLCEVGSVVMRRSTFRSSTFSETRPSCGTRFSAMSMSLMILMRETTPATIRFGTRAASIRTPSTRKRTRISPSCGSKCTSEAPSLIACPRIE